MARYSRENAEQTRNQLLDAAEEVFFKRGVKAASLEEVARTAGLTRGAVYWHFQNKVDLFNAMHERVSLPFEDAFQHAETAAADPIDALHQACLRMLQQTMHDQRMRRVFTVMLFRCDRTDDSDADARLYDGRCNALERCMRIFTRAQELGLLRPGVTPRQAALALITLMSGLFQECLTNTTDYADGTIFIATLDIYLHGIKKAG